MTQSKDSAESLFLGHANIMIGARAETMGGRGTEALS